MGSRLQRIVVVVFAGSLCLLSVPVSAESYRWKDKDGNVHYGAIVPPEYAEQPYDVISESGIVIEHVEDTSESMAARAKRAVKERAPLISEDQRRRQSDRLLVIQYQSEADIQKAQDLAIAQLGYDSTLFHQSVASTSAAIRDQIHRAADQQRAGSSIDAEQQEQIDLLYKRLTLDKRRISLLASREAKIRDRYKSELDRWRMLTADDRS